MNFFKPMKLYTTALLVLCLWLVQHEVFFFQAITCVFREDPLCASILLSSLHKLLHLIYLEILEIFFEIRLMYALKNLFLHIGIYLLHLMDFWIKCWKITSFQSLNFDLSTYFLPQMSSQNRTQFCYNIGIGR